jgi:hypothetical protein
LEELTGLSLEIEKSAPTSIPTTQQGVCPRELINQQNIYQRFARKSHFDDTSSCF